MNKISQTFLHIIQLLNAFQQISNIKVRLIYPYGQISFSDLFN
jgi:hypothetical protein